MLISITVTVLRSLQYRIVLRKTPTLGIPIVLSLIPSALTSHPISLKPMSSLANRSVTQAFNTPVLLTTTRTVRPSICIPYRRLTMKGGLNTRTAAITGASGGIGEQTAIGLVRTLPSLSKLFLCCRNTEKGESIANPLRNGRVAGRRVDVTVVPVELTDNRSIISCASTINEALAGQSLDLLICNAGIMACPLAFTSNEGEFGKVESQYAVNHLSHALLTDRLLPVLRKDGGRVLFVSSMAVAMSRRRSTAPLVAEKKEGVVTEGNYEKWKAYADSKLAMSLYAKGLAQRESDIESVSLHPGVVQTELVRHLVPQRMVSMIDSRGSPGLLSKFFAMFGLKTAPQGAELSIDLSTIAEGSLENGEMYWNIGLKKAGRSVIPLLEKQEEIDRVFADVENYLNSVMRTSSEGNSGMHQSKQDVKIEASNF